MTQIDPLSVISLSIEPFFNETNLGTGTGFIIERDGRHYLVTNWHVVSGLNPVTKKPIAAHGGVPNKLIVWHHQQGNFGVWITVAYELLHPDGSPRWKEKVFPNGDMYDVVLLEIPVIPETTHYTLDLSLASSDVTIFPSEPVSIIGFPFGKASAGKFPVWKTGNIASDLDLNYDDKPIFLIDTTTKPGMSGSPVIAKRVGSYQSTNAAMTIGSINRFMGIYSGRIQDEDDTRISNLGIVWKPVVIDMLLEV
jgi:S1-C subfamily serine protease